MNNTIKSIEELSLKIASKSKLTFLERDIKSALHEYNGFNTKETIKRLESAFVNANYAGDYKAGEFSFILKSYLEDFDITSDLEQFQI